LNQYAAGPAAILTLFSKVCGELRRDWAHRFNALPGKGHRRGIQAAGKEQAFS
jgi:hypothetical protein